MPQSPRSHSSSTRASDVADLEVVTDDPSGEDEQAESGPSLAEMRAAWLAQQRQASVLAASSSAPTPVAPAVAVKEPDPYELDDDVTLLLPTVYRAIMEGRESKSHRVFIGTEQPGQINEDTGRPERGIALTLTFVGGVCRNVPYSVVKGLKKSRAYRSNDAMKVIPNDIAESEYAKLCGVQPMQPQKQAALLLASDLDAVLAEFDTEQLKTFSAALARRVREAQSGSPSGSPNTASNAASGVTNGILNSQSFQRG